MTREEARRIIATWLVSSKGAKGQRGYIEGWFDEEDVEAFRMAIDALNALPTHREESQRTQGVGSVGWIPCSERLPKEDEYVGNVCKYYLIQDEYEDMHVAHLSSRGWETIESVKALGCDAVAWMPLPEPWKGEK